MNPTHRKTVNLFNHDIKTVVAVLVALPFIVAPLVGIFKLWWIMPAISLVFLVLFATSEPFKLWMISRKDLKENRVIKKEIVIEEFKDDYSFGGHHHGGIIERVLLEVVYNAIDARIKTIGGDKKYVLTDTEGNTYHLMNYYKTKMLKKDIKGKFYYSELKGRVIEIEHLENSKIILSIKMDKHDKSSRLVGGFREIFGGYMIN